MRKMTLALLALSFSLSLFAQDIEKVINADEVKRIETVLSSDDMQGRRTFTPGNDKAAEFIAQEFKKTGLVPVSGDSYFQDFSMLRTHFLGASGTVNGKEVESRNIVALSTQPELAITDGSGYTAVHIDASDTLYPKVTRWLKEGGNYFVTVDSAHARLFNSLKRFRQQSFPFSGNIVLVLNNEAPRQYSVNFKQEVTEMKLRNVVGLLPGKKKKEEYVIFSGHYDHLGIGKPNAEGDSIFNGANDDAAGTTAVIMLANYFARKKDNARSLVFAAFTAEEIGGYGSQYFSKQFEPDKVMAMFNIEMIGTESKWGTNSAYITGYEKTNMGEILQKNLEGSGFTFHPDPYTKQNLFYRSDNATLARLGVPAHTISTSKMDSEKYYHTQDDEIETLDMNNMAAIIRAVAISAESIIAGKDTPSRVDTSQLR